MNNIRIIIIALLVSLIWGDVALKAAAPVDEARSLFDNGQYKAAVELLEPVVKKVPKNLSARVLLGRSLVCAGQYQRGRETLLEAENRGSTDASRWLAEYALDRYDASAAASHLEKWKAKLAKSRKEPPVMIEEMQTRAMMLENLLGHVEKIVIVDSVQVPEKLFFKNYRLSRQAGCLLAGSDLHLENVEMVYVPENRREMIWAETDTAGLKVLKSVAILDDGTMEAASSLKLDLEGGDSDFPFLMPDGVTLYFANDGDGSLGGYDIYMTRREGDKCLEPLNMGMPYNSPANDYMMALDESTGLGWWATDRNAAEGYVTVYTFVISDVRTNYPADEPRIADYARIASISETQGGADINAWKEKIEAISSDDNTEEDDISDNFVLSLGDGRVIYTLDDLENAQALDAAKQLMRLKSANKSELRQLEALRSKWRAGDRSAADAISRLEAKTSRDAEKIGRLRNTVVKLETSKR